MKDNKIHISSDSVESTSLTIKRTPWTPFVTDFNEIKSHIYRGNGTIENPYIVDWFENDTENPLTWPKAYKWFITIEVAIALLAVTFCSSAFVSFEICHNH